MTALRIVGILLAALAAVLTAGAIAAASHWCAETEVEITPASAEAAREAMFTASVTNGGVDNTEFETVEFRFSWEGVWRNVSSGVLLAGQSKAYQAGATPPSPGTYAVGVRLTGTSSGDLFRETSQCTATLSFNATKAASTPGVEAPLVLAAFGGGAAAVALWRRRGRAPPVE